MPNRDRRQKNGMLKRVVGNARIDQSHPLKPIVCYLLNEGGGNPYDIAFNTAGALAGGTIWGTGFSGSSLNFDGSTGRMNIAPGVISGLLAGTSGLTMVARFKVTSLSTDAFIAKVSIDWQTSSANLKNGALFELIASSGILRFGGRSNPSDSYQFAAGPVLHIGDIVTAVGVINYAANTVKLFASINGASSARWGSATTTYGSSSWQNTGTWNVANTWDGLANWDTVSGRFFNGSVEFWYISRAIASDAEAMLLCVDPLPFTQLEPERRINTFVGPQLFPVQTFIQTGLFTPTITRSPTTYARRIFSENLLSELTPGPHRAATQTLSNTLFTSYLVRGPAIYAPQVFNEHLFPEALAVPVVISETPLFSESLSVGSMTYTRSMSNTVLTPTLYVGVKTYQRRTLSNTLFSPYLIAGPVFTAIPSGDYDPGDPFQFSLNWQALLYSIRSQPLNASKLLIILDGLAASFRQADLAAATARVASTQVNVVGGDGTTSTIYGTGDEAFILKVAPAIDAAALALIPDTVNKQAYSIPMSAIADWLHTTDGGNFANLDTYATAQNMSSYGTWLTAPNLAYIYFLYNAKLLMMSPGNVFAPATTFGTALVGGTGAITYTSGSNIATVNNAPSGTQGYVPSPGVTATITVATNGSLLVTVTGDGVSATGVPFTGHTWTVDLSTLSIGTVATFTPTVAGDRISAVTACVSTGTPTATAGAFTLASVLERVIS